MNKLLLLTTLLALALCTACSSPSAGDAPPADSTPSPAVEETGTPPADGDRGPRGGGRSENMILGRITAISETEITVETAEAGPGRPEQSIPVEGEPAELDGTAPATPAESAAESQTEPAPEESTAAPEAPAAGDESGAPAPPQGDTPPRRGERGGNREGGPRGGEPREITYSGETATYALAADAEIRSGDADAGELAVGDEVRLELDDDGNVRRVSRMNP